MTASSDPIRSGVKPGDTFASRGRGASYTVLTTDDRGFTVQREASGATCRVSWALVDYALGKLLAGETIRYQASKAQGGVSYTVAVSQGVAYALRDYVVETKEGWVLRCPCYSPAGS